MKKVLIFLGAVLLLAGCESKKETNENITKPEGISYTNKFECSRVEKIKKFDLDNKNAGRFTQEQMKERENSPVIINEKISKIYDFTKDGSKLLGFYEIHTNKDMVSKMTLESIKSDYAKGNMYTCN